ncbi:hypothetical protein TEA_022605 [Camellia sinensis var. sinensis]|uniref:Phosphatidic acid phosphatase type 2/haloperoxidase domain-containing protein n=1 Tax=Camellia sinensis var. sinensis TaxID=542762 RepID=A0A4S4DL66_CAMSN|nr:hypothetical protein TEA_022605 [Camellia sinensis var. sinensis]
MHPHSIVIEGFASGFSKLFQPTYILILVEMPVGQSGAHTIRYTIRSHGVQVAKTHMYDWLILLLLVAIEVVLIVIEPFHRFVGEEMITGLKYPLKPNTVPVWAVGVIAVLLPFAVILVYYFIRRDVYDFHHAVLGRVLPFEDFCLLFSVLITGVLTDAIKDAVGRPRPDFFWRCFPNGKAVFNNVTRNVMCTGQKSVIKEGYKSFPSGHVSWSFAGMGFLTWYLSGKIRVFDRGGHVAKLCVSVLPLLVGVLVAISRVDDYWHYWEDVFGSAVIGLTAASFCYLQFFPPPYDMDADALSSFLFGRCCNVHPQRGVYGAFPHAFIKILADSQNTTQSTSNNANRNVYSQPHQGMTMSEISLRDTSPILDEMESGRRY